MLKSNILTVRELLEKKEYSFVYSIAGNNSPEKMSSERLYRIPGYQREIRWKKEHAKVLIDDLLDTSKFLGIVLISTKDSKEYEVIDGQQRLTVLQLLIESLKKYSDKNSDIFFERCPLVNDTFLQLDDVITHNFFINKPKEKKSYSLNDPLNQYRTLSTLWKYINTRIKALDRRGILDLTEHLLDSQINMILSVITSTKKEEKRVCVDYFIDVNNKNVKLDGMDILKAYAFREDFDTVTKQWMEMQSIVNTLNNKGIPYKKQSFFLHYFICCGNKLLNYELTSIKDDYSIGNSVKIGADSYPAGTPIEILIKNAGFYSEMFERLKAYCDFLLETKNCGGKPTKAFKDRFPLNIGGEKIDNDTIENIYSIINGIIRTDEIVPKMLVMKYFLEVVERKDEISKEELKSIYYIEILAAFFLAGKSEKGKVTKQFDKLLLSEDWIEQIKIRAKALLNAYPNNISFDKIMKLNGKVTEESGQFIAKRVYAIIATCSITSLAVGIKVNEKQLKEIYSDSGMNVEHFLVNRKYTYSAFYGPRIKKRKFVGKIECPVNVCNSIATIANFLLIDVDVNNSLQNHTVFDKIEMLEEVFKTGTLKKTVFATEKIVSCYEKAKRVFHDESKYPVDKLISCSDQEEAKKLVENYYENEFMDEFRRYLNEISTK